MARYVIMNSHKFKNANVIEIPAGTGITGITVGKHTEAKKVMMVDSTE